MNVWGTERYCRLFGTPDTNLECYCGDLRYAYRVSLSVLTLQQLVQAAATNGYTGTDREKLRREFPRNRHLTVSLLQRPRTAQLSVPVVRPQRTPLLPPAERVPLEESIWHAAETV